MPPPLLPPPIRRSFILFGHFVCTESTIQQEWNLEQQTFQFTEISSDLKQWNKNEGGKHTLHFLRPLNVCYNIVIGSRKIFSGFTQEAANLTVMTA